MYIELQNMQDNSINQIRDFILKHISAYTFFRNMSANWDVETLKFINSNKVPEGFDVKKVEHMLYNRSLEQYLHHVVCGWLIEDFVRLKIGAMQDNIDAQRKLIADERVLATSHNLDLKVNNTVIEVITDRTGYIQSHNSVSLNLNKFNRIVDQKAFLLVVDIKNNSFLFLNFKRDDELSKQYNKDGTYKREIRLDYSKYVHSIKELSNQKILELIALFLLFFF